MSDLKPNISSGKEFSPIWIIPALALVLGIWMVVYTLMNEGTEFSIQFENADDLVAGKTKVKLLSVDIGQVESISLNEDANGVEVTVKLAKGYESLLRDDTQFWVERARVGAGGVSGLGTLLSGAYIKLAPGIGAKGHRKYNALELPPLTDINAPGIRLILESEKVSSINAGDSVLYKGYKVGKVESMAFDHPTQKIRYDIFIAAPFHKLINTSVRFWNVSGVALSATAEGINFDAESLESILSGGITFGIPEGMTEGDPVDNQAVFKVYDSYADTLDRPYKYGRYYVVEFAQSLSGLLPGAPVEYRGIKLGRVEKIMLKEMALAGPQGYGAAIPVLIYVEPGRFELGDSEKGLEVLHQSIEKGVANGLRATLQSGNLITGSLTINFDFYPNEPLAELGSFNGYTLVPSISGGFERIQQSLTKLLDKINNLPLEDTVVSANNAIVKLDHSLASIDRLLAADSTQSIPTQINAVLESLRTTLDGLSPESTAYTELNSALFELNETLQSLNDLSENLSDTVNVLPKANVTDPVPEAKHP